jgi:outer membrane protein insertion porin family
VLIFSAEFDKTQGRSARPGRLRFHLLIVLLLLCCGAVQALAQAANVISEIRVIGNRRIPKETVLARVYIHPGDTYDQADIERSFNSLWNTGYFEDVRIEREDTAKGVVLDIFVREKPTIREIHYNGLSSVSESDVLDRFKKEKVGLSVESQYDPTRIARAVTVLKELLGEHGHQFATIKTDVKTIPPASVSVNFNVKEGPTVKVGRITFTGNHNVSSRNLRAAMRNLRPIGIPHSIFFEDLFARTYDASKLEEDAERVRQALQSRGYFKAYVGEPTTHIRNEGGLSLLTFRPKKGKRIDIKMPIEEGQRYRLGKITFTGLGKNINTKALRAQFPIKDGDWFNTTVIGKGLENLRKAYGSLGYINFVGTPNPTIDEAHKVVNLNIDVDQGKQYYVSRIEFQGNTVTRDQVIRRELLLEEGQIYNSNLWESSILRLNQLDYFDPIKVEQDSTATQDPQNDTVALLLKVHEKGKNAIGLNGGVSGLSGSFLGVNYQTNNFLGLGETLSLQANIGDLSRNVQFGFTEPYFRNRPLSLGFQLFSSKYDYNSARNYGIQGNLGNITSAQQSLVQNYNQSVSGLTLSASYPIRRTFQRVGITYSFNRSSVQAFSPATTSLFQTLNFRSGVQATTALSGIYTSQVSLSYSYNKIGNPYEPRTGEEFDAALQFAGLFGNVRYINPVVTYRHFNPMKGLHPNPDGHNVLGVRFQAAYITGWNGLVAPPFQRFYAGGEADLRGFDIRGITPYGFIPQRTQFLLTNPDGTTVPRDPTNPTLGNIAIPIPTYGIVPMGGDVQFTSNIEYRIPLGGPVAFHLFDDFGMDVASRDSQLEQSVYGSNSLTSQLYGCPVYINGSCEGGQRVNFDSFIRPIGGTNAVPRMSVGGEIAVLLPIVRAPFRIYYAYNPLRLLEQVRNENLITRSMFPAGSAGDYSYDQSQQLYGSLLQLREPRKTFRLAVSTTF